MSTIDSVNLKVVLQVIDPALIGSSYQILAYGTYPLNTYTSNTHGIDFYKITVVNPIIQSVAGIMSSETYYIDDPA